MADIPTLSLDDGLLAIRSELVYTKVRLAADGRTAVHVADVQALLDRWAAVFAAQLAVWDGEDGADATVASADYGLDTVVGRIVKNLLHAFDRASAAVTRFLGADNKSAILKLGLQSEIARVEGWPASMPEYPAIAGDAAPLTAALETGRAALASRTAAAAARADFRAGTAARFVDDVNGLRQSLFGALVSYAAANGLDSGWAHEFFRTHVRRKRSVATS